MAMERPRVSDCPIDCPGCVETGIRSTEDPRLLVGWSLAGASLMTFLVPLVFAVTGALVFSGGSIRQLVGCVVGLLLGMITTRLLLSLPIKRSRESG